MSGVWIRRHGHCHISSSSSSSNLDPVPFSLDPFHQLAVPHTLLTTLHPCFSHLCKVAHCAGVRFLE